MRNKSEAGSCPAQPTLFVDFPHGGSESRSTSRTGATSSRMPRERAFIVITRTEPFARPCAYDLPVAFSELVLVLTRGTRISFLFASFHGPSVVFGGCPLHNSGVFRDAQREAGVCLPDSLANGQWMDWFAFSRRRGCHRSGLCARVPCICIALWVMMHDPCTFHPACLAGAAEQPSHVVIRLALPLTQTRRDLCFIRGLLWECQQFEPIATSTPISFFQQLSFPL